MKKSLLWLIAPLAIGVLVGCEPVVDEDAEGQGEEEETTEEVTGSTNTSSIGLPSFTGFSIQGKGKTDPEFTSTPIADLAQETDAKTVSFSIQARDRHSHPITDGTIIHFWAEHGIIVPTCETDTGSCSVDWYSGGDRPSDKKVTVLAYTKGEDSYMESGIADGLFDTSETLISAPEAFKDYNFNGYTSGSFVDTGTGKTVTQGDPILDFNGSGAYESSSTKFRGRDCTAAAISAGHCAVSEIWVWDHIELTLTP